MPVLLPLLAAWMLQAAPATAAEPAPRELTALRDSLARTQKLSARFKQTRHWAALQDALVTQGTIQYQKGGRLVWHTEAPSESELILEGSTATLRYPALGTTQAIDFSAEPAMGRVFESIKAVVEADLERLRPLFELALERKAPLSLALKPRAPELASVVERIHLEFDADFRLTRVVLEEPGGDHTEIAFSGHVIQPVARP
ncbi:outer membrane lipoprotein carrier protein LolA [Corallococcus sp. M34]|uniref:outer membrane lipoprotein carrier protein LolA n=1 Tax=Citreicoccus inhibens TaxID=2849499 RepID=UPI00131577CC|nr:outer membrane lipoprotein carrier protein LolA [Citreicoccus inhibens]MBU8895227.1 outer membrane lipoprotein carrier protein LolA [Citreicoccus inhibens]